MLSDRMRQWAIRDDYPPFKTYNIIVEWATEVAALEAQLQSLREFRCGWCGRTADKEHGLHVVGYYAKGGPRC